MVDEKNIPRRVFLKRLATLGGLVVTGSVLAACGDTSTPTVVATAAPTSTVTPTTVAPAPTTIVANTVVPTLTVAPTSVPPTATRVATTVVPTTAPATPTIVPTTVRVTTAAAPTTTNAATTNAVAPADFTSIGAVKNFQNGVNAPVGFKVGDVTGYVYFKGGNYQAFSNLCTHQGCEVTYTAAFNGFDCGCHGSQFDKEGNVIRGPARIRLFEFETRVVGENLFAKLK